MSRGHCSRCGGYGALPCGCPRVRPLTPAMRAALLVAARGARIGHRNRSVGALLRRELLALRAGARSGQYVEITPAGLDALRAEVST